MGFLDQCSRCGEFEMWGPCRCTVHEVTCPEMWGDEIEERWGCSPEQVAERVAEEYDRDDPSIVTDGMTLEVTVDGTTYVVWGELTYEYHANQRPPLATSNDGRTEE